MKTGYPKSFKNLLDHFSSDEINHYIGQGNPAANILFIGNECTAPEPHYTYETKQNFDKWSRHYQERDDQNSVPWDENFDPLWPWKSWIYGGNTKAKGRNSSKTWNAYQKVINELLPENERAKKGEPYNLWQHCFITELSTYNMPHSPNRRIPGTDDSIQKRLLADNGILRSRFFQDFPIIILGCYHYKDIYNIDILTSFNQQYIETPYDSKCGKIAEFIHKHFYISEDNKPHLLLHTNHFCMRSNAFLEAVGLECRNFIKEYNIEI